MAPGTVAYLTLREGKRHAPGQCRAPARHGGAGKGELAGQAVKKACSMRLANMALGARPRSPGMAQQKKRPAPYRKPDAILEILR
jgi:hypothetical protein